MVEFRKIPLSQTEPVSAKGPTFSSDLQSSSFQRRAGSGFAILCQAQAYPVPFFRYVSVVLFE